MDAPHDALAAKKVRLLDRAAELEVQQRRRLGLLDEVPRFSEIEEAGQKLGRFLSCLSQSRLAMMESPSNIAIAIEAQIRAKKMELPLLPPHKTENHSPSNQEAPSLSLDHSSGSSGSSGSNSGG